MKLLSVVLYPVLLIVSFPNSGGVTREERMLVLVAKHRVNGVFEEKVVFTCFIDYFHENFYRIPKKFDNWNRFVFLGISDYFDFANDPVNFPDFSVSTIPKHHGFAHLNSSKRTRDVYINTANIDWHDNVLSRRETIHIFAHEIFHIFGFPHRKSEPNLMYPTPEKRTKYPLKKDVVAWVKAVNDRANIEKFRELQNRYQRYESNNCENLIN